MRLLLDTHAVLWHYHAPEQLGTAARDAIESPEHDAIISTASLWEMAIKASLGKLTLADPLPLIVAQYREGGLTVRDVQAEHCMAVQDLPFHHRDPFDRLLVAVARLEGLSLVSRDAVFDTYGIPRIW
ncbi:MAG: type II toxin-antitoxin system VapC family toxin [Planctomycetota bacterium]